MREPSLLPVFGKLGAKSPAAIAVAPARPAGIAARLRELLTAHGGMALKVSVVAWTVSVLGVVFFMMQGLRRMPNRYALRMDLPQSFAIIDVFTGQPAEVRQRVMVGMNPRDANAMLDQMNVRDVKRRERAERKP